MGISPAASACASRYWPVIAPIATSNPDGRMGDQMVDVTFRRFGSSTVLWGSRFPQ